MTDPANLSSVEKLKLASNYLRGTIAEELANEQDKFKDETSQLLKFHGMYQQDDRDRRMPRARTARSWARPIR